MEHTPTYLLRCEMKIELTRSKEVNESNFYLFIVILGNTFLGFYSQQLLEFHISRYLYLEPNETRKFFHRTNLCRSMDRLGMIHVMYLRMPYELPSKIS